MDESKIIYERRSFLNPNSSSISAISAIIELVTYQEDLKKEGLFDKFYAEFSMSDCNRIISLDFNEDEYDNSIKKMNTIIETLTDFKESFIIAKVLVDDGKARLKEIIK